MGKESKRKGLRSLLEYVEPLSDIYGVDIGVLAHRDMVASSYTIGRLVSATKKRLVVIPYFTSSDCGVYVDLKDNSIHSLEIKTIRSQVRFISDSSIFNPSEQEPTEDLRYEKSIFFYKDKVYMVGRFLRALMHSMSDRKLKITTTPERKPDAFVHSTSAAYTFPDSGEKKEIKRIVSRKKEFFFREKMSEVANGNG